MIRTCCNGLLDEQGYTRETLENLHLDIAAGLK